MDNQLISFEYCHVTPDTNWDKEIILANQYAPKVLKMFPNARMQKCIMVDDLQTKAPLDMKQIKDIINRLIVKPDIIYLESSFVFSAANILKNIDQKIVQLKTDNEEMWLRSVKDRYGSLSEFLLSWRRKDGEIRFSCPTLVASSYLFRSGIIESKDIEIVFGDKLKKADKLLNLLSSRYLQVEANAQLLLKSTSSNMIDNIRWIFI